MLDFAAYQSLNINACFRVDVNNENCFIKHGTDIFIVIYLGHDPFALLLVAAAVPYIDFEMKRRTVVLIPFNDLDIFINTPQSSFNRILSAFVFVDKKTLLDCLPLALN